MCQCLFINILAIYLLPAKVYFGYKNVVDFRFYHKTENYESCEPKCQPTLINRKYIFREFLTKYTIFANFLKLFKYKSWYENDKYPKNIEVI